MLCDQNTQSAHFSEKQHTLDCSIFRDLIRQHDIKNEDVMIRSDNAPTHKNRHSFALLQNLANELNLRIIYIYGAAGHGKGTIDAMSSFGVSKETVECLHIKTLNSIIVVSILTSLL